MYLLSFEEYNRSEDKEDSGSEDGRSEAELANKEHDHKKDTTHKENQTAEKKMLGSGLKEGRQKNSYGRKQGRQRLSKVGMEEEGSREMKDRRGSEGSNPPGKHCGTPTNLHSLKVCAEVDQVATSTKTNGSKRSTGGLRTVLTNTTTTDPTTTNGLVDERNNHQCTELQQDEITKNDILRLVEDVTKCTQAVQKLQEMCYQLRIRTQIELDKLMVEDKSMNVEDKSRNSETNS
eukprot:TRINITY_DN9251_c0_g2_i2.p1 TRINITY_DN9251_c0_g2~~TRINITY_DN9251_c0_g2_i2.p1  ORF type:complete len:234 (-),score=50.03 TRINITY_DN9251_c0_g2_i2:135-836(-)